PGDAEGDAGHPQLLLEGRAHGKGPVGLLGDLAVGCDPMLEAVGVHEHAEHPLRGRVEPDLRADLHQLRPAPTPAATVSSSSMARCSAMSSGSGRTSKSSMPLGSVTRVSPARPWASSEAMAPLPVVTASAPAATTPGVAPGIGTWMGARLPSADAMRLM